MAYRLKKDESIPQGLQRVFAEEISWAVGHLVRSKKRAEAVHEARKSIKKIRGLLELLGPGFETHDRYFRDAGKLLSDVRDNAVMLEVFDDLAAKHSKLNSSTAKHIRINLRRSGHAAPAEKEASAQVVALLRHAPVLTLPNTRFDSLMQAMEKTYRRGRKALKKACKEQNGENLHDFRKQVKRHWYHLRLFEREGAAERLKGLHDLETWLGDDHNLCVLRARLDREAETSKDRQEINQVLTWIDGECAALRHKALALGEQLFSHKTMHLPKMPVTSALSGSHSAVA